MDGRFVSYLRVSTTRQGASGLGLEAQREAVAQHLNGGNWKLLAEFVEVESGKKTNRAQLHAALERCTLTGATLLVAKMDRLSRNLHFLTGLQRSGVKFVAVDNPQANDLTVHILAAVAEAEGKAISARTKAALAASKARRKANGLPSLGGWRGGPMVDNAAGRAAIRARADEFAARLRPMVSDMRGKGLSLRQIAAVLAEQGIQTSRGGAWSAMAVSAILA
jgi:DNA invertase Pin-like site-specific DNA recombinase